jgi:hypothetical protein
MVTAIVAPFSSGSSTFTAALNVSARFPIAIPSDVTRLVTSETHCSSGATFNALLNAVLGHVPSHAAVVATVAPSAVAARANLLLLERSAAWSSDFVGLELPVVSRLDFELNRIAGCQTPEAFGEDGHLMDENIFAVVIGSDETVAFGIVEPANLSGQSHRRLILLLSHRIEKKQRDRKKIEELGFLVGEPVGVGVYI